MYISIHAPLTGSDCRDQKDQQETDISIHAPLTGSDLDEWFVRLSAVYFNPRSPYGERPDDALMVMVVVCHFNPRSPYGERPPENTDTAAQEQISIHAPLTGSDIPSFTLVPPPFDFNPRSPYGERRCKNANQTKRGQFQSTLPLRGATCCSRVPSLRDDLFQSTLPLRGAT